ncbi:MAG: nuclear transport factor 2 family protein [Gammaproteobacteria bacterium]
MTAEKHELQLLEERLRDPEVRRSPDVMDQLIAEEFLEFGASGRIWRKADVLTELPAQRPMGASRLSEFTAVALGGEHALVTYQLYVEGDHPPDRSWRSSVWKRTPAGWQMVFHQGTRIVEGPAG